MNIYPAGGGPCKRRKGFAMPTGIQPGKARMNISYMHATKTTKLFVGSCLATKVFIGNLLAMGREWVIMK